MLNQEHLSCLIGNIYECALSPALWGDVLSQINTHMDGAYTAISLAQTSNYIGRLSTHTPWDQSALLSFSKEWGVHNIPGLGAVAYGNVDMPRSTVHDVGEEAFQTSDFYRLWVKPQGLRDACICKYAHTADRIGIIVTTTFATRDSVTADERKFMKILSPHLRRAAMIGDLLDFRLVEMRLYRAALDSLKTPVILVGNDCRLTYANESAQKLISGKVALQVKAGLLHATNSLITSSLHDAVSRSSGDGLDLGERGIAVPISDIGSSPIVAYVLPLNRDKNKAFESVFQPATAAIFLSTALTTPPDLKESLRTIYDLTPSEARVAVQIFEGLNLPEVAAEQGVSENTIKTHLSHAYNKLGVRRQAELVKIIAAMNSPLVDQQ